MQNIIVALMLVLILMLVVLMVFPNLRKKFPHRPPVTDPPAPETPQPGSQSQPQQPQQPQPYQPQPQAAQPFQSRPQARQNGRYTHVGGMTDESGTVLPPILAVQQLDEKAERVVHTFFVSRIPDYGVRISRPTAQTGEIKLLDTGWWARSVSQCHIAIGEDDKGLFWLNRDGRVKTKVGGILMGGKRVKDGDVLYLGAQPIRLRELTPDSYNQLLRELSDEQADRATQTQCFSRSKQPEPEDLRRRFRQFSGEEA